MSNMELAVREPASLEETKELAKIFAASGFFTDSREMAQAVTKIIAGRELGFGPMASMTGVFIINNRVALSANLMASAVKRTRKYDYRIVKLDDDLCDLEFFQDGKSVGHSTFTKSDAKRAGTKNMDKFPRNMLFARAISNGVKWFCADVTGGNPIYTPEELGANTDEEGNVIEMPMTIKPGSDAERQMKMPEIVEVQPSTGNPPQHEEVRAALAQVETVPHPDTLKSDGTYEQGALDYKLDKGKVYVNILIDQDKPSARTWVLVTNTVGMLAEKQLEKVITKVTSLFVHETGPNKGRHNEFERTNHLKKHFQKGSVAALTFEELAALLTWKIAGVADARWYADKLEAEPATTETFEPVIGELATDYGITTLDAQAVDFLGRISRMKDPQYFRAMLYNQYHWSWATHASEMDALALLVDQGDLKYDSQDFLDMIDSYSVNENEPA